jgi:signal transduction histidine kinase
MRPLDQVPYFKLRLGAVIVVAVGTTVFTFWVGVRLIGLWPSISGIAAGSLAMLVVWFLTRGMTAPLREITSAAEALARHDYSRRVEVTSADEIGRLADAFNRMADELAETDRVRREIVANVSHELRTPITALRASLENIVDGVENPEPEKLAAMLRQVERLGRLVTQLLDLSRLESGAAPLHRQSFEVAPLLEEAARESRMHAPHTEVAVRVESPSLAADGDPERIHQVVANLLENAVRFTPSGGMVEVHAHRAPTAKPSVVIEVCDEGPGIPEGERARVFERFYRADPARSSREGGAGLGLAIAQWIVDVHGGSIHPESRHPRGCRMVVELPAGTSKTGSEVTA